jgi:cell division protein FtsN
MKIVCPKCELKGQVDMLSASAKLRIACVRCATTFDAISIDGQIQALLPQASPFEANLESASHDVPATELETAPSLQTQTESELNLPPQFESKSDPADDFFASSTDAIPEEAVVTTPTPVLPQEHADEFAWQSVGTQEEETPFVAQSTSSMEMPLKSIEASKAGQPSDMYGLGVRLMRVSPMWLLLAGLSFISFIVLCNWLIKPDAPSGSAAHMLAAADNHATNQSSSRVVAPNSTAQSPVATQPAQSTTESRVAFIPTEAKEATAAVPQAAPGVETLKQPVVEEKAASSAASPSKQAEAAGKVTIQIGSYNEAGQAEERVANLKSAGYEARSVAVEIPKRGTWYRVQSGRFVNRDEAERYGKQLREKGIVSSYITTDVQE